MSQAFVYIWKNKVSLRWYLGSRTRKNCHPHYGYICSSKIVKPLIKKNYDEWGRTILAIGEPIDMVNLETELLTLLDAKNDIRSYNMHNGDGKFTTLGISFISHNKGKPSPRKGIPNIKTSISLKGRKQPTVCRIIDRKEISISNFKKWLKHEQSPELRLKNNINMSNSKTGKPMKKVTCPHCNKTGGISRMTQYHFDNCKLYGNRNENN